MSLLLLCLEFMKTGLFAIGGGLATIPFLYEISNNYGWFTHQDILNFIAIAESTPGAIGINMSTFAGYITHDWYGGILATLSLVFPSIVVVLIVAKILDRFRDSKYVNGAFHILRPTSTAMIGAAALNVVLVVFFDVEKITFDMFGQIGTLFTHVNWIAIIVCILVFIALRKFNKVHPIFFILACAVIGIIFKL